MRKNYLLAAIGGIMLCAPAYAQTALKTPSGAVVDAVVIWCAQTGTTAGACNLGGGGVGGGPVTQSTGSSTTPWWFEGLGIAGTPSGGVLSIQGVPGGTPQAVATPAPPATLVNVAPITIATTGTAVAFASVALVNGMAICGQHVSGTGNAAVIVNNTSTVFIGPASVTIGGSGALAPGQCTSVAVSNANGVFANGMAGDGLNPVSAN